MKRITEETFSGPHGTPEQHLRIGDVADVTGLTQRTIRYYEELGLLPPPERTQGDFRLYTAQDVRRLAEIARLKELLGFSLAEIKQIVEADEVREQLKSQFRAAEDSATRLAKLRQFEELTTAQLAILDRKMAQMAEMKAELEARLARYRERILEMEPAELFGREA
jgi:DNA-binding transcriptional MerR regulator